MSSKTLLAGVLVVVVVAAVAIMVVVTQLDRMVADGVETYGRAATGTDVSVSGVDISLADSSGSLSGLTIRNPTGFTTDYALRMNDILLDLDLRSVTGEVPVITEILVDDAHLNVEQRGNASNLTDIQGYMAEAAGESDPATEAEDEGRIIIDHFLLTNARVTLTSEHLSEPADLELGDVVVDGIGRASGGATYGEATEAVLDPILTAARSAVQDRLRDAAADAAREELEDEANERLRDLRDRD